MPVDLRSILRAQGRRRPLTLRPIFTTKAQEKALARLYVPIVQVWRDGTPRILREYERTLSEMVTDAPADVAVEIESVDQEAVRVTFDFRAVFREWAEQLLQWHVTRLGSQLTYATGIDLTTQLGRADLTVADFLERNTALVRDVSDQTRGRIADIVFRGLQLRTPVRDVGREIAKATGLARARSLRIANDQTVKLSGALDALRGQQLGAEGYLWKHSGKVHYRPEHKERDGEYFEFGSEVDKIDPPGYAPFCGCHRQITFDGFED